MKEIYEKKLIDLEACLREMVWKWCLTSVVAVSVIDDMSVLMSILHVPHCRSIELFHEALLHPSYFCPPLSGTGLGTTLQSMVIKFVLSEC